MNSDVTTHLQKFLQIATHEPEGMALRGTDALSHICQALMQQDRQAAFLPLLPSKSFETTSGWSGLAVMILAEWLTAPSGFNTEVPEFNTWFTSNETLPWKRSDLQPHWDKPMAWGSSPDDQVTLHGLWAMAQVAYLFSFLRYERRQGFPPEKRMFMDIPLIQEDLPALMGTALTMLNHAATSQHWLAEVAKELAVIVIDDLVDFKNKAMTAQRRLLVQAYNAQPLTDRLDQLTGVCRLLTLDDIWGSLAPGLLLHRQHHQHWFQAWARTLRECEVTDLNVEPNMVAVHIGLLNHVVQYARKTEQESPIGQVAGPALRSLHALSPAHVDPDHWLHQFAAVTGGHGQCLERQATEDLAQWIGERNAKAREAKSFAAEVPSATAPRVRQRP